MAATVHLKTGETKLVQLFREVPNGNFTGVSGVTSDVTWESSDENIATVSSQPMAASSHAVITAASVGTATVTANSTDGLTDVITVVVSALPPSTGSIG